MMYCASLQAKDARCQNLRFEEKSDILASRLILSSDKFFQTSKFDNWQFGSPLSYKDAKYLIWSTLFERSAFLQKYTIFEVT